MQGILKTAHNSTEGYELATFMAPEPRVLVLMAAYNGAQWISEQITTVLGQTEVNLRLVVADDGSSDSTCDQVRQFAVNDDRIALNTAVSPSGSAGANFRRLFLATDVDGFSHVALCDQDDIWHLNKLSSACRLLSRCNASLYSAAVQASWSGGRKRVLLQEPRVSPADFLFEGAGQGCTFVMTTDFFVRVQQFVSVNESLLNGVHYHDWLIYALARSWNAKWVYDAIPHMVYRQHGGNDTGARGSLAGLRRRMSLIWSGWYAGQVRAIAAIGVIANPLSQEVRHMQWLMHSSRQSLSNRLQWCCYLLTRSRRRQRDRSVLCLYALLGAL